MYTRRDSGSINKLFKGHILKVEPYLADVIQKYGLRLVSAFWGSEEAVRLMANENPYGPSPKVKEAIINNLNLLNRYPDPTCFELKNKLAEYTSTNTENIVLGNGSLELIDNICKSFLNLGDEALVTPPTYENYVKRVALNGGVIKEVKRVKPRFEWNIEKIIPAITEKTKVVFVGNPNNPVGNCPSKKVIEELLEENVVVVVDEAYFEYCGKSCVDLIRNYTNLIVLRTFSKAFGLAGLRIGYGVASEELVNYLWHGEVNFHVHVLALKAACAALNDLSYMREVVRKTVNERKWLFNEFKEIEGFKPYPSKTNFILVEVERRKVSASSLVDELINEGIILRDYTNKPGLKGKFFRVTVGKKEENRFMIEKLKEIL